MRRSTQELWILTILLGSILFAQPQDLFSQGRNREVRKGRREVMVVKPPADRARIVVRGKDYYYSRGVYYRTGPKGYVAIRGPVGARIRVLPPGFVTVRFRDVPFFVYYGTYYQLDPATKDYVVVSPPEGAPAASNLDRIELVTGETIDGTFIGGTQSTIQVEVNGQVQEIPLAQIVSISFAPPSE